MRILTIAGLVLCWAAPGARGEPGFFSFLPGSDGLPAGGKATLTTGYTPSGSTWAEGLDERSVFHAQFDWRGAAGRTWALRVGGGGQIYSFRGPFGESVPPQVHEGAPWIDEIWQIVSVSHERQNRDIVPGLGRPLAYFIHGSGTYLRDPQHRQPFYCPMLASAWDPARSRYGVVAWGQHAHVPTIHRSGALYYTVLRALADGVVEVTYAVHNFGQDTLDYFNTPWGGVRHSSLPVHVLSRPDGSWRPQGGRFGSRETTVNVAETGGWAAFVQDGAKPEDRWGLGLVFGRDRHGDRTTPRANRRATTSPFDPTRYRWGYAGNPDRPNPRDYFVAVVNPRCRVRTGQTFWYRVYFVVDTLDRLPETARRLVPHADYGFVLPSSADTPLVAVTTAVLPATERERVAGRTLFYAWAWPVAGATPLFLLREAATGKLCITDDPYRFASSEPFDNPNGAGHPEHERYAGLRILRPYDGRTEYLGLLGYGLREDAAKPEGPRQPRNLATILAQAGFADRLSAREGIRVIPALTTLAPAAGETGRTPASRTRGR